MSYPALEDIYDLSTEELRLLEQSLQRNPNSNQELLETVQLEIQERKTLQFFAKLCEADNPYTKKIADFNEQFIRLAEEAIHRNQSIKIQQQSLSQKIPKQEKQLKTYSKSSLQKPKEITPYCLDEKEFSNIKDHKETDNQSKCSELDQKSVTSQAIKNDNMSVTSIRSTSKDSEKTESLARSTLKMGIGFSKKKKDKMANIISNTLARTKVDEVITIKRSGYQEPIKNKYDKKYHIPGQKHQNLQLKKRSSVTKPPEAPQKQSNKVTKKMADPQKSKKIKQVVNRTKSSTTKSSSVKLPKLNPYTDLVAMVKKQQQDRKAKTQKTIQTKLNEKQQNLPPLHPTKKTTNIFKQIAEPKRQEDTIVQEIEGDEKGYRSQQSNSTQQQIMQEIDGDGEVIAIPEQQFEQSMSPEKYEKIMAQKKQVKDKIKNDQNMGSERQKTINNQDNQSYKKIETKQYEVVRSKDIITTTKQTNLYSNKQNTNIKISSTQTTKQIPQNNPKKQNNPQQQTKQQQTIQNPTPLYPNIPPTTTQHKDYTKLLIQQIEQQQKQQYYFFNQHKSHDEDNNKQSQEEQPHRQLQQQQQQQAKKLKYKGDEHHQRKIENNKIYNQEYWAHIREQAQLKIKRFRQEKEIEELMNQKNSRQKEQQKQKQKQKQKQDMKNSNLENSNTQKEQSDNKNTQKMIDTAQKFNTEIEKKRAQLQKMKKKINKNGILNKKNMKALIPKTIYPKPQFNYLQIYPTFNHIFCTTYLKPAHQSNSQIPNLMRQLKLLYTANIQHFQQTKTTFQPALFLPFDHHGSFNIKDPKQLLLHAENTYIDLKVMVHRMENFNKNIRGNFQGQSDNKRYFRVVKSKQEVYDIITTSFLRTNGWKQLPHGSNLRATWNLFWSWSKPDIDLNKLLVLQKINHFPFNKNLSRKDLLFKNLDHFKKAYRVPINFLPITYNLPKEFSQLSMKFHEEEMLNKDKNYWIMKPIGKSRGRGIKVISSLSQLNYIDNIVVQKYISNPILLDGYKFDMRIYVLVTHFHPLQAFVYRQGFARLSTQKFSMDINSIKNTFIHLTNFSINKNNLQAKSNFIGGSKISLKTLKDKLTKMGYNYNDIWKQVHDIIIKSLLGCSISVPSFPGAFELFGYDVMIDTDGQCHLIEINSSPSLERSFIIDDIIKQNMIDDLVDIVDPPDFDKKQLVEVLTERIQMLTDNKKITPDDDLLGLARILRYRPVRKVGEVPQKLGLFEIVAPCQASRDLQKLIKSKSCANNPQNID